MKRTLVLTLALVLAPALSAQDYGLEGQNAQGRLFLRKTLVAGSADHVDFSAGVSGWNGDVDACGSLHLLNESSTVDVLLDLEFFGESLSSSSLTTPTTAGSSGEVEILEAGANITYNDVRITGFDGQGRTGTTTVACRCLY